MLSARDHDRVHATITYLFAPLLGSNFVNFLLAGLLIPQIVSYFVHFPDDRIIFKALVVLFAILSILETIAMAMLILSHYGDLAVAANVPWQLGLENILMATGEMVVQFFFAWQIWRLSGGNLVVVLALVVMTITTAALLVWLGVESFIAGTWDRLPSNTEAILYADVAIAAVTDFAIVMCMVYWLLIKPHAHLAPSVQKAHRNRPFMRAVLIVAQSNAIAFVGQIVLTVLFALKDRIGFWFLVADATMVKLYFWSLLLAFNSREPSPLNSRRIAFSTCEPMNTQKATQVEISVQRDVHVESIGGMSEESTGDDMTHAVSAMVYDNPVHKLDVPFAQNISQQEWPSPKTDLEMKAL